MHLFLYLTLYKSIVIIMILIMHVLLYLSLLKLYIMCMNLYIRRSRGKWIRRLTTDQEIAGSSPAEIEMNFYLSHDNLLQPIISTIFTRLYIKIDSDIILSSKMCEAKIHLPLYFV